MHGHLTSSNVLIDSRWVCKISDFGLTKFKKTGGNNLAAKVYGINEETKFGCMVIRFVLFLSFQKTCYVLYLY